MLRLRAAAPAASRRAGEAPLARSRHRRRRSVGGTGATAASPGWGLSGPAGLFGAEHEGDARVRGAQRRCTPAFLSLEAISASVILNDDDNLPCN